MIRLPGSELVWGQPPRAVEPGKLDPLFRGQQMRRHR